MNGNKILGLLITVGVLVYVVSPVDLLPGPIDDAIIVLCTIAASRKRIQAKSAE